MKEFIEENRRLLKVYCIAALIIGWVLILAGGLWFISVVGSPSAPLAKVTSERGQIEVMLYSASALTFDFFFPGLFVLGIMEFIKCLIGREYHPHPILRNGQVFLYIYAGFLVGGAVFKYFFYIGLAEEFSSSRLLFVQPLLLPVAAKVLILIGLGRILKRILPVIEESKTLV